MFGFLKSLFGSKQQTSSAPLSTPSFTPLCLHIFDADSPTEPRVVELRKESNWIGVGHHMDIQVSSRKPDGSIGPVSRTHVCIQWEAATGRWILLDDSTNGTFLNGQQLTKGRPQRLPLNEADIRLGGLEAIGMMPNYAVCPLIKIAPPQASIAYHTVTPLRDDAFMPKPAVLEFVNQCFEVFPTNLPFTIGTGRSCNLTIPAVYAGVAEKHLYIIQFSDKGVVAEIAEGSSNVRLDKKRVEEKRFDWPWGSVVEIGTYRRATLALRQPQKS